MATNYHVVAVLQLAPGTYPPLKLAGNPGAVGDEIMVAFWLLSARHRQQQRASPPQWDRR